MIIDTQIFRQVGVLLVLALSFGACNSDKKTSKERAGVMSVFDAGPEYNIDEINATFATVWEDTVKAKENLQKDLSAPIAEFQYRFYKDRTYTVAWMEEDGLIDAAQELFNSLEKAKEEGLNSEDYRLQYLYHQKQRFEKEELSTEELVDFDQQLTTAYLQFAYHKLKGRMNPDKLNALWKTNRRSKDLARYLAQALSEDEVAESLSALEPKYKEYAGLKKALKIYRKLKDQQPVWPALPENLVLRPGDSSKYVTQLRKRLRITGEYAGDTTAMDTLDYVYDDRIKSAVATYQFLNGLEVDSIVAGQTIGMLNIPVNKRIDQIMLNLERLRWMPVRPDGRHIRVNVPEFKLYVYEGEEEGLNMRVVVGKAYKSNTPIFNDSMEYIAFSPTWTVPKSIIKNEMLPRLKRDPGYLTRSGYRLYMGWDENAMSIDPRSVNWDEANINEYRIVQQPGPGNALGMVKFMFPNNLSIYLHDTPSDHLFANAERDYSHGCIRVEEPTKLATYLLQDRGWDETEVRGHFRLPEPKNVALSQKVPVFIEYRTAWLDDNGQVNFREDIYGHDARQAGILQKMLSQANDKLMNKAQASLD